MFGEYAQVASFYDETGKDYYETDDSSYLPSYLLPKPRFSNPWSRPHIVRGENYIEDEFILVAEFSELEGPKPLITIPTDGGADFDKNGFSVKILSVDQQSTQRGFNIPEDNQIYITDEEEKAFSFVHHFVLLDHEARGYVRPFCMAYVSHDSRKVLENYESFSQQFHKVANYFKYGNRLIFRRDCEQKLEDLRCTKDYLINMERLQTKNCFNGDDNDDDIHASLKTIETLQHDFQVMLEKVSQLLTDKKMEEKFQRMENGVRRAEERNQKSKSDTDCCSLQNADPYEFDVDKCGSFTEGKAENSFMFWDPQKYKPTVVNLKQAKRFERTLRGLHELCFWGAKEGLKFLRCMHEYYSKDRETQEMQLLESSTINPLSSVLTFGNCAVSNFMSGINMSEDDECFLSPKSNKPCHKFINRVLFRWPSTESFKSVQSFISIQDEECSVSSAKSSCGPASTFEEMYRRSVNDSQEQRKENEHLENHNSNHLPTYVKTTSPNIPLERENTCSNGLNSNIQDNYKASHEPVAPAGSEKVQLSNSDYEFGPGYRNSECSGKNLHSNNSDLIDKEENSLSSPSRDSSTSCHGFSSGKSSNPVTDTFYSAGSIPISREDSMDRISDIRSDSFHSIDSSSTEDLLEETGQMKENVSSSANICNSNSLKTQATCNSAATVSFTSSNREHRNNSLDTSPQKSLSVKDENLPYSENSSNKHCLIHVNKTDCLHCDSNTTNSHIEDILEISNKKINCSSKIITPGCNDESSHNLLIKSHAVREKSPISKLTLSLETQNGVSLQNTQKQCPTDVDTQYSINNGSDETDEEALALPLSGLTRIRIENEENETHGDISRERKELVINNITNYMFKDKPLPGDGILKMMTSYNNIQHIIHSLLCGRPVIVLSTKKYEDEVKSVINALWMFVPGMNSRPLILHNANKMLKITDICGHKLLGIVRADKVQTEKLLPNMMKQYASVFDIEKRQITAPPYKGSLLNPLINKKKSIKNDDVCCLRIFSFLSDLSSKAFVFYHTICLGSAGCLNNTGVLLKDSKAYRETVRLFLSKQLNVADLMDQSIIQYLAEVVKQIQIEHLEELKDRHFKKDNRLSTDHQQCQTFKC